MFWPDKSSRPMRHAFQFDCLPVLALTEEDISRQTETGCRICLSDYVLGEVQRELPCMHTFHRDCIDHWLRVSRVGHEKG